MAFLSGSFGPTRSYPGFLQAISDVLPLTYLIRILKVVYLAGWVVLVAALGIAIVLAGVSRDS